MNQAISNMQFPFKKRILLAPFALILAPILFLIVLGEGFGSKNNKPQLHASFPLLFAHRGVTTNAPENSIAAIQEAKNKGFKALEIDISKTKDCRLILFHDSDGKRLLDTNICIKDVNFSNLQKLKITFQNNKSNQTIPSLAKVIELYHKDFYFYLDMKTNDFSDADSVVQLIKKHHISHKILIASADIFFTSYIEFYYPEINTVMEGFNQGKEWRYYLIPKKFKSDFFSSFIKKTNNQHIQWLKEHQLLNQRIVYGVTKDNIHKANKFKIPYLIVDYHPSINKHL